MKAEEFIAESGLVPGSLLSQERAVKLMNGYAKLKAKEAVPHTKEHYLWLMRCRDDAQAIVDKIEEAMKYGYHKKDEE